MELQNSTVLVTGASGNLGPSVTDQFVELGADLVGTYFDEAEKEDAENRADNSGAVSYYQVDLTDQEAVEAIVDEVIHLLSNESVTGQIVQMTGGQPEVSA